ncbi:hypothetical protein GCM10010082_05230 [Kushneria pakistanensis]|uniref:Uncharacterized protein n=1 Tax=Kushneria pakistanensis TaxID=1508770 RepID=A0ABQ3FBS3_9GAMM|nr:hypothetical protein [Kushneria pakistanensis]GHC17157.1 hypothetical protein GCM10010082_05230 [Kushneria pakistanensis]
MNFADVIIYTVTQRNGTATDKAIVDTVAMIKATLWLQYKGGNLMKFFKRSSTSVETAGKGCAELSSAFCQSSAMLIDDSEYDRKEGFVQLKHRLQRAEWRQRQAYYEKYGSAPAPSIIRPGKDWLVH